MLIGPAVALAMLTQAANAAPVSGTPPAAEPMPPPTASDRGCPAPGAAGTTIVICTQRPQGYRLDPDVMEAKREMKGRSRPPRQGTEAPPPDCATVGPAPCVNAGINLLAAVATAAEMAKRLASGQEVGSMFVTDPHPSEYQLYQMAKARREAADAERAAAAARAKAQAAAALAPAAQLSPSQPTVSSGPAPTSHE